MVFYIYKMSFYQIMFKNKMKQSSIDDINNYDYKLQLKIQNKCCRNCKAYGVWDDDWQNIIIPCANCAEDNNYMWNGTQCLGISGLSASEKREQTSEEFAFIIKEIIYPRFHGMEKEYNDYIDKLPDSVKKLID